MTQLDRYVGGSALKAFLLVAAGLAALFSLLEFVEQLKSVGEGQYRVLNALVYVLLTSPSRLLQVAPVAMLIGTLLALGGLAKDSELTALRALCVSEVRIIASVLKVLPPVIAVLFVIAEFIVPPTQHLAITQRSAALADSPLADSGDSLWAGGAQQYLNVQRIESKNVLRGINIYDFSDDGRLETFIHAERAEIGAEGPWLLREVTRKSIVARRFQTEHLETLSWQSFLPGKRVQDLMPAPENMSPTALYRYARAMTRQGQRAVRYEQELWNKIGMPLAMVAMALIAAPFVFGPPRSQNTGQQITIGAGIGIVFSLTQQISNRLDLLLNLNPAVTALGPSCILIGLAAYLFYRSHRVRPVPAMPPPVPAP
ncbi:LPS export ABC transporter permease LptG [Nitrospirillum sp. BR 11828]|uniref:LPS export ABC transporter permease LptG n=1 Tax=Nitrospirillum sp. BR 11828 TaxID=3104325 RepID=UPI002ACAC9E6|nr:LPS export ABC transporter permease LptG [Nitrospirillum sp. BR 11828]MDZ5645675.1 LPS export ABC transporter permease LptG [Nitrospirillum sp. BR 11828]